MDNTTTDVNIHFRNKKILCTALSTTTEIRKNLPQILAVCVKNVMLIGIGMTLGFPTVLIGGLEDSHQDFHLNQEQLSWLGAINLIFVPLGCLASGPYSEKFGRKRAMQIANVPLACVWLLFRYGTSLWHLYSGLAIIGILLGLIEAPVVTYVTEVTTPNLRGILFSSSTLFTILGTLSSFLLGSMYYWRSVAQICFFMPLISLNLLFIIPESPHWLIKKNRNDEAQAALAWLRGWVRKEDIQQEYATLNTYIHNSVSEEKSCSCTKYASRSFIKPYLLVTSVFFLRHFSGITNIQTYAVEIFGHLHSPMNKYNATIMMGVCELIGCITCATLIRKFGKRKLTFAAMLLSCLSLMTIPIYNYGGLGKDHNWIPMSGLFCYCYFSHCSLRILPWILIGEVYTPQTRSVASGISAATGYLFGFLANKMYYVVVNALTLNGLFIMFIIILLVGIVVLYFIMPETEGKTLDEICNYFSNHESCIIEHNNKDVNKYYDCSAGSSHNNNTDRTRKPSIEDFYMISLDRLDANNVGPSYKRFDDVSNELFY